MATPLDDAMGFVRRRPWFSLLLACVAAAFVWLVVTAFQSAAANNRQDDRDAAVQARLARQALVIERDLTALRIRAEQTADCPVLYLQGLLAETAKPPGERDFAAVDIPDHCEAQDLDELTDRLRVAEAEIALMDAQRRADG